MLLVRKKWPKLCIMDKFEAVSSAYQKLECSSRLWLWCIRYSIFLLSIELPLSKTKRTALLFTRGFLTLFFVALFGFGPIRRSNVARMRELQQQSSATNNAEKTFVEFNPYMLLMPYFTFIPIMAVVTAMSSLKKYKIVRSMPVKV